ncbi:MAG: STAS/SEC14 domain-containing protein [Myxococcales bacterium]|nr:STAS/SEC14 domain-containing protein [Myxococcales bacterium]USN49913.1 MAG: STAS/SEC14 domain-containing protein [Myxococcales bacterium]
MIKVLESPSPDILAFEGVGKITKDDYQQVINPAIEKAYQEGKKIRFLYYLGEDFEEFSLAGAWEDFKIGARYLSLFERCAIVSDKSWIRNVSKFVGSFFSCEVKVFKSKELNSAMAWLNSGAIALEHHLDYNKKILLVSISGPLRADSFDILSQTVDPWLQEGNQLNGIVIHAHKFPGWENLGALFRHIKFIKNHHKKVHRIAICADGAMSSLVPNIAKHFVKAQVKHFESKELEQAKKWAAQLT